MRKNKSSQYLIPYIDFAFMVIIMLIALLSIAYFTPPGESINEKREERDSKLLIPLIAEKKDDRKKALEDIKIKERKIRELEKKLQKKDEDIKLLQEKIKALEEEIKKLSIISTPYPGGHEFTDLGRE